MADEDLRTQLSRMESKLDRVEVRQIDLALHTAENTVGLASHLREELALRAEFDKRIPPLEKHAAMWMGVGKFGVIALPVIGTVLAILSFMRRG